VDTFLRDVRYSFRMFLKSPGFTITAVAALALGIGGTTAIFSIVDPVLLKPLQIPDADRLVVLATTAVDGDASSPAKFVHWRSQSSVIEDVSAYIGSVANYTGGKLPEQWQYMRASASLFHCFGLPILRGRAFTPEEDIPNGPAVALISQGLWNRRFASDPKILGQTISLNGEAYTVIGIVGGVTARDDYGGPYSDVYVPFQIDPRSIEQGDFFDVVARLKPGVALEQAKARLEASTAEFRVRFPNALGAKDKFTAKPYREDMVAGDRPLLMVLSGAVSLVLLIACANVANLLLVRAVGRRREIAIRAAIGAGRGRVIRQLLTESVLLSVVSGTLGLLLGYGGIRALLATNTASLALVGEKGSFVNLDWRLIAFSLGLSFATGILFGLLPALQASRADLHSVLKNSGGATGTGLRQNRIRSLLVVSEVGLAVVLLIGSSLLIRTFVALYAVDPGFETKNVITMNVLLAGRKYSKSAAVASAVGGALDRLRSLPGVVAAGATCCLPLAQGEYDMDFEIIGQPPMSLSDGQEVGWATGSPGYFEVLKIPVKRGRAFRAADDRNAPAVVLINERMAERFWKGRDPLGDRIAIGRGGGMKEFKDEPVRQIVGIVGDIRSEALDSKPRAIMYVPQAQLTDAETAFFQRLLPIAWLVRTEGEPTGLIQAIQEQLRQATGLPVTDVAPMSRVVWGQTGRQRFSTLLMSVFGTVALLLAAVGIYGLMAYTVEERRQEIGIRLALGAESRQVRNMVVRQGMSLALGGVVVGLGAAWSLTRLIAGLLYGVGGHDALVFIAIPVLLSVVALLAVLPAANRASGVNPSDSLRYE
jgi:putative ABC transport system permease protein